MDRPIAIPDRRTGAPATDAVCPYLLAADRSWRAASPDREHRCTAVAPMTVLTPDKQRRLCLVAEHRACATYRAAAAETVAPETGTGRRARTPIRPYTRTAPVVLDRGRVAFAMPALRPERGAGQMALVGLMSLALVAIVFGRTPGIGAGGSDVGAGAAGSTSRPSDAAVATPTTRPAAVASEAPVRTLVPTEVEPTTVPEATPTPSDAPTATDEARTYKVKRGDTLSGIAAEFGTTWQEIAELNDIDDPGRLKVGQVLELP